MADISASSGSILTNESLIDSSESLLNDSETSSIALPQKRRYGKWSYEVKEAVLKAYREGGDWRSLAKTFKIRPKNVYRWSNSPCDENGVPIPKARGGNNKPVLGVQHKLFLMSLLESENNDYNSCRRLKEEIFREFNLKVSDSTIWRALHGMLYTKKNKTHVSGTANDDNNLEKRKQYCLKFQEYQAQGKSFVYLDETNYNLFCTRSRAWSKKGTRAVKARVSSKGSNLVIFGAISPLIGTVLTECHFMKVDKAAHDAWLKRVVDATRDKFHEIGISLEDIIFVIDNAPAHNRLEEREVNEYLESQGAKVLRLGPYSAPLNPIELFWNTMKNDVKEKVGENLYALTDVPDGVTQVFHRGCLMIQWANEAIDKISVAKCASFTQKSLSKHNSCINKIPLLH